MKADIEQERTLSGKLKPGQYELVLSEDGIKDLHYLRLSGKELDAIAEAWAVTRLTVGDAGVRRMVAAERAGAKQESLL
jgi:hypothetical protein